MATIRKSAQLARCHAGGDFVMLADLASELVGNIASDLNAISMVV
jgi:hypothetical protein